jgi:hypothetical protein
MSDPVSLINDDQRRSNDITPNETALFPSIHPHRALSTNASFPVQPDVRPGPWAALTQVLIVTATFSVSIPSSSSSAAAGLTNMLLCNSSAAQSLQRCKLNKSPTILARIPSFKLLLHDHHTVRAVRLLVSQ